MAGVTSFQTALCRDRGSPKGQNSKDRLAGMRIRVQGREGVVWLPERSDPSSCYHQRELQLAA